MRTPSCAGPRRSGWTPPCRTRPRHAGPWQATGWMCSARSMAVRPPPARGWSGTTTPPIRTARGRTSGPRPRPGRWSAARACPCAAAWSAGSATNSAWRIWGCPRPHVDPGTPRPCPRSSGCARPATSWRTTRPGCCTAASSPSLRPPRRPGPTAGQGTCAAPSPRPAALSRRRRATPSRPRRGTPSRDHGPTRRRRACGARTGRRTPSRSPAAAPRCTPATPTSCA